MNETPYVHPTSVSYKGYTKNLALSSVGVGWASLIHEIFDFIEQNKITNVRIIQVKEKYGGLRIYTDFIHDVLDKKIQDAEVHSFTICEECGAPGQLRGGSWYNTLCEAHGKDKPIIKYNNG